MTVLPSTRCRIYCPVGGNWDEPATLWHTASSLTHEASVISSGVCLYEHQTLRYWRSRCRRSTFLPFARAVEADGWLHVSGQVAMENGEIINGGIVEQTHKTMQNLIAILEEAVAMASKMWCWPRVARPARLLELQQSICLVLQKRTCPGACLCAGHDDGRLQSRN